MKLTRRARITGYTLTILAGLAISIGAQAVGTDDHWSCSLSYCGYAQDRTQP